MPLLLPDRVERRDVHPDPGAREAERARDRGRESRPRAAAQPARQKTHRLVAQPYAGHHARI